MKKAVYTILTLCIGVVIGMTSTVTAAPVKQYVQASFEKIKFIVNGEEKNLDADPLVYQGTTYLPVRTVLNALGYDVGYKADTKTVTADKSLIDILGEVDKMTQGDEQKVAPSASDTSSDAAKQIIGIKESIEARKEVIKNLETAIEQVRSNSDLSAQEKEEMIFTYESRIEQFNAIIQSNEEKIKELQN